MDGGNTLIWAFVAAVLGGGLLAAALGYFLFYGEVGDVQTTVVTVAATLIMFTVAIGLQFRVGDAFVGGDNGMIGIPPLAVGWGDDPLYLMPRGLFNATVLIAALMYIGVKGLMARPFGLIVNAVRINPLRTSLLGYDVRRYRFLVFTLGGAIAGLAGALYAAWGGFVSPAVFGLHDAARVVTWVLVGGKGSLAGAFVGALGVESFTYWLSGGVAGGQTTLVLGSALIVAVLFLPGGVTGVFHTVRSRLRRHMWTAGEPPSDAPEQTGTGAVQAIDFQSWDPGDGDRGPGDTVVGTWQETSGGGGEFLRAEGVFKRFGGLVAVNGVTLGFRPCHVYCMIGPNGAGKSTFFNLLVGRYRPDGGRIVFAGHDITRWSPHRRARAGIGIKLQVASIFDDLTVWDNMWLAAYARRRDTPAADRLSADMLRRLGLADKARWQARHLSHGEQQWLDIGMVIALDSDVILLDEPTAGMTRHETKRAVELVRLLSRRAMVMVVEHDMEFVRELGAPVLVLHRGSLFASGTIDELRQDPRVLDIYLGRAT